LNRKTSHPGQQFSANHLLLGLEEELPFFLTTKILANQA
jgi:hypothetical protein